jgi:transcriptional regulator with PAS, ATPase and Fis domain
MDKEEALEIISMIADGLDPYDEGDPTKELPENNPVTMRAVCTAIVSLFSNKEKQEIVYKYGTKKLSELTESVNGPLADFLREKEKGAIWSVLQDADYNEKKATKILRIDLSELRTKIQQYGLNSLILTNRFFSENKKSELSLDQYLKKIEVKIIREALNKANFIKKDAAKLLRITFRSLRYKVETYRIEDLPNKTSIGYMENFQIESLNDFMGELEKEIIVEALNLADYNKTKAASMLGISFRSLRYRIEQNGI